MITTEKNPQVISIFDELCRKRGSRFFPLDGNIKIESGPILTMGERLVQECSIASKHFKVERLHLPMLGKHQVINASAAVLASQLLHEKGYSIDSEHLRSGLESTKIPGRIQLMNLEPLIVLDVSHNYRGVLALKQVLEEIIPLGGRLILVAAYLDDKDRGEIARAWGDFPSAVIVTKPESSRGRDWKRTAEYFKEFVSEVYMERKIEDAVILGENLTEQRDCLCMAGSFYMMKNAEMQILQMLSS